MHGRPEGGKDSPWALGLWELAPKITDTPEWPIEADSLYPELVVRGLTAMLPAMSVYHDGLPEHAVDGGYYTKTVDNIPTHRTHRTRGILHMRCVVGVRDHGGVCGG